MTNSEYIDTYAQAAMEQQRKYGIPASITLAQGILESASGGSRLAREANNHFGIKASSSWLGQGGDYVIAKDDRPDDKFCKFASVADSFEYHSKVLSGSSRYSECFSLSPDDYKGWSEGLQKAGYATDPHYAEKLQSIIEKNGLQRFDVAQAHTAERTASVAQAAPQPAVQETAGYSMPLDRDFLLVTRPFGMVQDGTGQQVFNRTMSVAASHDALLSPEDGARVTAVHDSKPGDCSVTVQLDRKDGSSVQLSFHGLDDVKVKAGDMLRAGEKIGTTGEHVDMSVRVVSSDGFSRDLDPAAYLADISAKGNLESQVYYNGTDLLAKYSSPSQQPETMSTEAWMKKLMGSEGTGLTAGMSGGDSLVSLLATVFISLLAIARELDGQTLEQRNGRVTEQVQNRSIDLTRLVPDTKECSVSIADNGSLMLHVAGNGTVVDRPLSVAEQTRLNSLLANTSLSDSTKRQYLGSFITGVMYQQQASQNFDVAMDQSRQQDQQIRRGM